jgi:hypothetical protein
MWPISIYFLLSLAVVTKNFVTTVVFLSYCATEFVFMHARPAICQRTRELRSIYLARYAIFRVIAELRTLLAESATYTIAEETPGAWTDVHIHCIV